jgi:hypothetical protein
VVISLVVAVLCLAVGVALARIKKDARHLLAPALVPLALVPAVLVCAIVAAYFEMAFSGAATDGSSISGELLVEVVRTVFAARLCSLVLLAIALLLAVRGLGRPVQAMHPRGRAVFLVLGPALAVAMTLLMGWSEGRFVRTVTLVLTPEEQMSPAVERELKELVTGSRSADLPHIKQISERLARDILLLTFGTLALVAAFAGLTGMLAAAGWRPPHAGSSHLPAVVVLAALAAVGASTLSAYRRIVPVHAFADAMSRSAAKPPDPEKASGPPVSPGDPAAFARCETGDARACAHVGGLMADADRLALYTRVCEAKGGEVCADLASIHLNGVGTAADPARAKTLYERACRTGDASACGLFERLTKSAAP